MLRSTALRTISKHKLLSPGDTVVVAVSGGPDSVCLLSVLHGLAKDHGLKLHVAHLDHGFRGQESAGEAQFVSRMASGLGIPCTVEHRDVPAYCAERGLSAQAGAREVRYAFLERVADTAGAQRIALGHTADDQAETMLMRLIRGAGLSGLSGIPPKRGRFVRPLIEITREQVLAYLVERSLPYVTDPSNERPVYTRNRVRQEIMPVLRKFNPGIAETLAAEADMLRDEDAAMGSLEETAWENVVSHEKDQVRIDRDGFLDLPTAVQRRVLRRAVALHTGEDDGLSSVQTGDAIGFIAAAQTGRKMELMTGLTLAREYGAFLIRPSDTALDFDIPVAVPGRTTVECLNIELETSIADTLPADGQPPNYLWQAVFDYDKITLPLRLRSRRPGDAIRPSGMSGRSKKLQDLFVDEKVPRHRRDKVPLLTSGEDVLWVVGMRTDERFLPGPGMKKVLVVTVRNRP